MPDDNDEPPTERKANAIMEAKESEARIRKAEHLISVATTPAPIDYANMAALLASVPRVIVSPEDVGWFDLDDETRDLLALVDGTNSVAEIAARATAPNILSTLQHLEQRGIIERTTK